MDATATAAPPSTEKIRAEKPRQGWGGLIAISLGFFGIQIGFALQNANMSRIFQTLGTSLDDLPALWVAAPLTGLLVQPIIGHYSDRTWSRLGRRRPYFLAGAIFAAASLFYMPLAPVLLSAALTLWILDASLNVSMEPFRAFVGDMLRKDQHTAGYAVQTAFIGAGAVVGSAFPWMLDAFGVANEAAPGAIPDTVKYSFWFGGVALLVAVLGTVLLTKEYSPAEMAAFDGVDEVHDDPTIRALAARSYFSSSVWLATGVAILGMAPPLGLPFILKPIELLQGVVANLYATIGLPRIPLEKEISLLGLICAVYGLLSIVAIMRARKSTKSNLLTSIVGDFAGMPPVMKQLAVAQFFSWSALFIMWINTTPVVAQYFFGSSDPTTPAYNEGGNWVGIMFAVYNGVAAIAALTLLPWLAEKVGKARTHMICLLAGAAGYASFFLIRDPQWLLLSEVGVGIAWASILAMPYAILASSLPQRKLGIYMGLFNIFIVVPQLLVATVMGSIVKAFFPTEPIYTMAFAAGVMALAALAMLRVQEE
jgi:maltose/moltooligosaccharide transporter